jgi:hypothetical protein
MWRGQSSPENSLRAMAVLAFGGPGPPLGEETMERIRRREQRGYSKLGLGDRPVDLERTERTLRNIRKALAEMDARLWNRCREGTFASN